MMDVGAEAPQQTREMRCEMRDARYKMRDERLRFEAK
jgi:hypothetical protein